MKPILSIDDLTVSYRLIIGKTTPLRNLKLRLEEGKLYGIIGETGSGKSTLIKAIAGTLPNNAAIESGTISFKYPVGRANPSLGVVLQNPYETLHPTLKIETQFRLTYGLISSFLHNGAFKNEAKKFLTQVNLPNSILSKYPAQLSGGMNQRVNIALTLLKHPKLLILDEPTSSLDSTLKCEIMDLLKSIQRNQHLTEIIVSHDIKLLLKYTDIIYYLRDGLLFNYEGSGKEVSLDSGDMAEPNHDVILTFDKVSKSFEKLRVLDTVSFSIQEGSCFGIVGDSGSGKTTLCKIVMGLYQPDSGRIWLRNHIKCEMLFQDTASSLDPSMSVRQILNEARCIAQQDRIADSELAGWLKKFDLPESLLHQKASQLSGGQQQMIAIIRILLSDPDLIILDEPTSSMDVFLRKQTLDFLKKIQKEYRLTYILVSHDEEVISYMCNDTMRLS